MIYSYKQIFKIGAITVITFYLAFGVLVVLGDSTEIVDPVGEVAILEPAKTDIMTPAIDEDIVRTHEKASNNAYFDVPLSQDLQDHIFALCEKLGLDASMVIAIISVESTYNPALVGDNGNSLGLMQIQPRWHSDRMDSLGCSNLLDPYQNVIVGVDFISELYTYGGKQRTTDWVLMAYNGGPSYANKKTAQGVVTHYVDRVYDRQSNLKEA